MPLFAGFFMDGFVLEVTFNSVMAILIRLPLQDRGMFLLPLEVLAAEAQSLIGVHTLLKRGT